MTNISLQVNGLIAQATLPDGKTFVFDADKMKTVIQQKWYYCRNKAYDYACICSSSGIPIHRYLLDCPKGYEVDHINTDTMDNRLCNLRITTHQQNQCNQPQQKNNKSGVTGVRFYKARGKYVSRIKVGQKDIHLGYYVTFNEAVQARNVGIECMFGEYGRYNDVPPAPERIRKIVVEKCRRFAALSLNKAFLLSNDAA